VSYLKSRLSPRGLRAAGFAAALGLASLALTSSPVAAVNGCQGPGTETVYYNNASLSHEVGRYTESCTGSCTGSGAVTPYYVVFYLSCPPPPA
jgi:hypothetical protein